MFFRLLTTIRQYYPKEKAGVPVNSHILPMITFNPILQGASSSLDTIPNCS